MNYECQKCGKKFTRKYNLEVHYNKKIDCTKGSQVPSFGSQPQNQGLINPCIGSQNPSIPSQKICINEQICTEQICTEQIYTEKIFQCPTCLKIVSRNDVLQNHIKNKCKGPNIRKIKCDYCAHIFSKPSNLKKHNNGYCKIQNEMGNILQNANTNANTNVNTSEILEELKNLKEEIIKLKNNQKESPTVIDSNNTNNITINNNNINNNINNNNTTQNITNTQNIILVAFGKENFDDVLTHEEKIKIFERGLSSVTVLTEHIHFNEKNPQYNNCYISNRRDNTAVFYDGRKWSLTNVDNIVQTLIDNGKYYLESEYNESKEKYDTVVNQTDKNKILSDKAITQFGRYLAIKDDEDLQKRYDNDMKLIMYNNKDIVIKNKKRLDNK